MLEGDRICGPTHFGKAQHLSHQSFLLSYLHKIKHGAVTHGDSYFWFPRSLLGMPGTMIAFWQVHTHTHTQKKCLHFLSLAAKITTTCSWPGSRNQYGTSVTEGQMPFLQSVPSSAEQETWLYFQVTIRANFRSF